MGRLALHSVAVTSILTASVVMILLMSHTHEHAAEHQTVTSVHVQTLLYLHDYSIGASHRLHQPVTVHICSLSVTGSPF